MIGDRKVLKPCVGCNKKKRIRKDRQYCSVACANKHKSRSNFSSKILAFSDSHIPFHDIRVFSIIFQIAKLYKPTKVIVAGDLLDCNQLSRKFSQPGSGSPTFGEEVEIAIPLLEKLRNAVGKKCDILLQEGNHEHRLKQLLNSGDGLRLKGVKGLTIQDQLKLSDLGIRYQECPGSKWFTVKEEVASDFSIGHFSKFSGWSSYAAKNIQDKFGASFATGHGHSFGTVHRTTHRGIIWGYELGCTCIMNPDYMDPESWAQGISLFNVTDDGKVWPERMQIEDGRTIYRGTVING